MSIENMITTIDALADKEVGSGASAEAIQAAEQSLEVRLPKDYDAFLRTYGWARLMYDELYGVGDSVPEHLDLIANTVRERVDFRPYLPKYLVPVLADGAGNHYCLDVQWFSGITMRENSRYQASSDLALAIGLWVM
jgi:cell wall assembly regulator SMI1